MVWRTRKVWHQTSAAGSGYYADERYWVPDPVVSTKPKVGGTGTTAAQRLAQQKAAAKQRRDAQAKLAAERKAAAIARARKKIAGRSRLWAELGLAAKHSRASVLPNTIGKGLSTTDTEISASGKQRAQQIAAQKQAEADKRAKAQAAENARWAAMAKYYARVEERKKGDRLISQLGTRKGTKTYGQSLEAAIKAVHAQQKESGGTFFDPDYVIALEEAYNTHAKAVDANRKRQNRRMAKFFKPQKNKNDPLEWKNEAAYKAGMHFMDTDKQYLAMLAEYKRLFGQQGEIKPTGSYMKTYGLESDMEQAQRNHLYRIAKNVMRKNLARAHRDKEGDTAEDIRADWHGGGKYMFGMVKDLQGLTDPYRRGFKTVKDKKTGKNKRVRRTVDEEFEARRKTYIDRLTKEYEAWQTKRKGLERRAGMRGPEAGLDAEPVANRELYESMRKEQAGRGISLDKMQTPTMPKEIQSAVDRAVNEYTESSKVAFLTPKQIELLNTGNAYARNAVMASAEGRRWLGAIQKRRSEYYLALHAEDPGPIGAIMGVPFVPEIMDAAGLPVGGIGSAIRLSSKLFTGHSQVEFAVDPTLLPKGQVRDDAIKAFHTFGGLTLSTGGDSPGMDPAVFEARQRFNLWARSPEGQRWFTQYNQRRSLKESAGEEEFVAGMSGDVWSQLRAISRFGQEPFTGAAENLLFQIVADPTNAIPMKFTTWAARLGSAKLAAGLARDSGFLMKTVKGTHRWFTVSEAELRLDSFIGKQLKALGSDADPSLVRQALDNAMAGIDDVADKRKGIARFAEWMGITPRSPSAHQLQSLAEEAILEEFKKYDIDYISHAEKAKAAQQVEKEAAEAAKRSSEAEARLQRRRQEEQAARNKAEAEQAYTAEERIRAEQEARLRAAQPIQPAEAVPTSPSPARPAPTVVDRPVATARSTVTHDAPAARTIVEREAAGPGLTASVADPLEHSRSNPAHVSRTTGSPNPRVRQLQQNQPVREVASTHVIEATVAHRDLIEREGIAFVRTPESKAFLASDEYRGLVEDLDAKKPDGRPDQRKRDAARSKLYQVAREYQNNAIRAEQGAGVFLNEEGVIPWEWVEKSSGEGGWDVIAKETGGSEAFPLDGGGYTAWMVSGQKASGNQYILKMGDIDALRGARSPSDADVLQRTWQALEKRNNRLLELNAALRRFQDNPKARGALSPERYLAAIEKEIKHLGIVRTSADLLQDLRNGFGQIQNVAPDAEFLAHFIALGEGLIHDFLMTPGGLSRYYEAFSLLPTMWGGVQHATAFMESILDQSFRKAFSADDFAQVMGMKMWVENPTPAEFRMLGQHLFALFHLSLLDGDLSRLYSYSEAMDAILLTEAGQYNVWAHMWKVMESRSGLPWAREEGFEFVENQFIEAVLHPSRQFKHAPFEEGGKWGVMSERGTGTRMHPNFALGMISPGPAARPIGRMRGYRPNLQGLARTTDKRFLTSGFGWEDSAVLAALDDLAHVRAQRNDMTFIGTASQVIHYIASRYGDVSRRAMFQTVADDLTIEAIVSFAKRQGDAGKQMLDDWFAEELEHSIGRDRVRLYNGHPKVEYRTAERRLFDKRLEGMKPSYGTRLEFRDLRKRFDRLYWANRLTHNNPGLHTQQLFLKLQDANIQRGQDWRYYAESYFDHMVAAGYGEEARVVLRTLFDEKIASEIRNFWQGYTNAGRWKTAKQALAGMRKARQAALRGGDGTVQEFMLRTGLIDDKHFERGLIGQVKRRHPEMSQETQLLELEEMRNEFVLTDDELRAVDESLDAGEQVGRNDFGLVEQIADEVVTYVEAIEQADLRVADIDTLTTAGPNPERVAEAVNVLSELDWATQPLAVRKAMTGFTADEYAVAMSNVVRAEAEGKVLNLLTRVGHQLLEVNSIPVEVGEQIESLIALVEELPQGRELLVQWVDRFGGDLLESRLMDFIKYEEWFEHVKVKQTLMRGAVPDTVRATGELRDEAAALERAWRSGWMNGPRKRRIKLTKVQRDAMKARLDVVRSALDVAEGIEETIVKRERIRSIRRRLKSAWHDPAREATLLKRRAEVQAQARALEAKRLDLGGRDLLAKRKEARQISEALKKNKSITSTRHFELRERRARLRLEMTEIRAHRSFDVMHERRKAFQQELLAIRSELGHMVSRDELAGLHAEAKRLGAEVNALVKDRGEVLSAHEPGMVVGDPGVIRRIEEIDRLLKDPHVGKETGPRVAALRAERDRLLGIEREAERLLEPDPVSDVARMPAAARHPTPPLADVKVVSRERPVAERRGFAEAAPEAPKAEAAPEPEAPRVEPERPGPRDTKWRTAKEQQAADAFGSADFVPPPGRVPEWLHVLDGPYNRPERLRGDTGSVFEQMNYGEWFRGPMSKLHVAGSPAAAQDILRIVDGIARDMGVPYKFVPVLQQMLDDAAFGLGGVQQGKFITIYPDPAIAREFTERLDAAFQKAGITGGHVAPSERRWAVDSPITHRYVPDASLSGNRYAMDGDYAANQDVIGFRGGISEESVPEAISPELSAANATPPSPGMAPTGPASGPLPNPPDPAALQSPRVARSQRALEMFGKMSEEEWLAREYARAVRTRARTRGPRRQAAYNRMRQIERAMAVIEHAKSGGDWITHEQRARFAGTATKMFKDRIHAVFSPGRVAAFSTSMAGAKVELGRSLYMRWREAEAAAPSHVGPVGTASPQYVRNEAKIKALMGGKIQPRLLLEAGFDPALLDRVTVEMLVADSEGFAQALGRNKRFAQLKSDLLTYVDRELKKIAGPDYNYMRWAQDRVAGLDHYDGLAFEKHDRLVAARVSEARGEHVTTITRRRRDARAPTETSDPLVETIENDIRAVIAKNEVLAELGIDPHAYNEMRFIYQWPMVAYRKSMQIGAQATQEASDALYAMGITVESPLWDVRFEELRTEAFIRIRAEMAAAEAERQFYELAAGDMYKAPKDAIIRKFEDLYTFHGEPKSPDPTPLTPFQMRSLEANVKRLLEIDDIHDVAQVTEGLHRYGQSPPFASRTKTREWLTKYGFWTPRTAQRIEAGEHSWSLKDEADYYRRRWGTPPDWANDELVARGGPLHETLHYERDFAEQNRVWGLFDRNFKARLANARLTRAERAQKMVEGDVALDLKAKRDLAAERKYVIDRYGDTVTDGAGNLTAFPWLMHEGELREYFVTRASQGIDPAIVQNAEELSVLHDAIRRHMTKYFDGKVMAGKAVGYDYLFPLVTDIVHDLIADPVWLKRNRDALGWTIRAQAEVRRSLVFTNIAFLNTNVIDAGIKGSWSRFSSRSLHSSEISDFAKSLGREEFGLRRTTSMFHDETPRGWRRWQEGTSNPLRAIQGLTELPAQGAGAAEHFVQLRLAQSMYDEVLERMVARGMDPETADVAARKFIGEEVTRLWPTSGNGPIEQLFNSISPFLSYQFKNHVLYISELAGYPAFWNWFDAIGDYVEAINRAEWEEKHPHEVLPTELARRIELPWAPGEFLDVGQISDIQRGIAPLYDLADGSITVNRFAANFVRLVGPNDLNVAYSIFNAIGYKPHREWVQGRDKDGYPNGEWTQVVVPWEAPWGGEAMIYNSFWPTELAMSPAAKKLHDEYMLGKFDLTAATHLFAQTMFFGGLKTYDKGAGLQSYYFALKEQSPAAAKAFMDTPEGHLLSQYWQDRAGLSKERFTTETIQDMLDPSADTKSPDWFFRQDESFQIKVKRGWDDLDAIRAKWDAIIVNLTPGTKAFQNALLDSSSERWRYYEQHPWMFESDAMWKTPKEWAAQLSKWETDDLLQGFYDIEVPVRTKFKTEAGYQKALADYRRARSQYLKDFPTVAARIAEARGSLESVWKQTEQGWFDVLDKLGRRGIALNAAKQADDYDLVDQLYVINDLEGAPLDREVGVSYYDPATDFEKLPKGAQGPLQLKKGPLGTTLLPRVKVLPDFAKWRWNMADKKGKAKIEADHRYGTSMAEVIKKSKASANFGATFMREIKKDPWLLKEYFERNPGKKEQWAANDAYFSIISRFGILMKQGKFDAGYRYFDSMPEWVKDRYFNKHPEKRGNRAKAALNLKYIHLMKRWTDYYRRRDYAGGAAFFEKLPAWAKEKYYAKHPDGFGRGATGSSPYSRAMGKWVKLLQDGDREGAKAYFDSMPQAYRDRYYKTHPEQKLRNNIKRTGQLGEYFAADDAGRAQYLRDNPNFARWLHAQGDSEATRRMLVLAGYRALPADNQWLKRVYREKYPEVFSPEAKGEQSLKKTYKFLAEHPDMLPAFEKWLEAVWASYAESMKHAGTRPKAVVSDHSRVRAHGMNRARPHSGKSAAWVRLHSLS